MLTNRDLAAALVGLAAGGGLALVGCTDLLANLTTEVTGNVTVIFINNTPYRASFSYGTYDAFDRVGPGEMQLRQLRLEGNTVSTPVQIRCARNFAVGTQGLYDRAVALKLPETQTGFDADAFDTVVHFSDQPEDSDLAAVATVGTAPGIEKLLGVHYTCGDRLFCTFVQDPNVSGGFRIDFFVIKDEP